MNIVIDVRPLMEGKLSGIEVYIINLLNELFKIDHKNNYILFANASKDVTSKIPIFQNKNVTVIQTRIPNKILNLTLSLLRYPKLDKLILKHIKKHHKNLQETNKIDLFFMPDLRPSALSKSVTKITTIHDLSFFHFKNFFSQKTKIWYKLVNPKREIKNSHKLIAVSTFTKNDLIESFKILPQKITVIYEAVSEKFAEQINSKDFENIKKLYHLPAKYYLFLSTIEPRKNIQNLIKGFIIYKRLHPNDSTKLVIAGSANPKIFSKVALNQHEDILFPGFIHEENKASIIKNAEVFLYPSFFEGFGLPLLEAMKCGTPIITSNTSSMPEVVGDAAILINPNYPEAIAEALERIQKPEVKADLKKNMTNQINKFSWKKCAQETLNLFQK